MTQTTVTPPALPQMMVSNIVQLVNEGDVRFSMEYGPKQHLVLEPGQRLFVNEEVGWYFLGSWWMDNSNPRNRERATEYQRLRTLYGAYEDDTLWAQNGPKLAAYAPDGSRITSVVDDPEGVLGGTSTQMGREMSLESQIAVMQDTILSMQAQLAASVVQNANDAQPTLATDTQRPPAPPGPPVPGQSTASIGVAQGVPVAPPTITAPPEPEPDIPVFGKTLIPTVVEVSLDPQEATVPEDAPQSIPHGPAATGGRISA